MLNCFGVLFVCMYQAGCRWGQLRTIAVILTLIQLLFAWLDRHSMLLSTVIVALLLMSFTVSIMQSHVTRDDTMQFSKVSPVTAEK